MNWLLLAIKLIPTVIQLVGLAERAFGDTPGSGGEKKKIVMEATEAITGGVVAISTGGQAETWERIKDPISTLVDSIASIAFPHENIGP